MLTLAPHWLRVLPGGLTPSTPGKLGPVAELGQRDTGSHWPVVTLGELHKSARRVGLSTQFTS